MLAVGRPAVIGSESRLVRRFAAVDASLREFNAKPTATPTDAAANPPSAITVMLRAAIERGFASCAAVVSTGSEPCDGCAAAGGAIGSAS